MIMPTIRASVSRQEALQLVDLLGRGDLDVHGRARARLEDEGVDAILEDPRLLNALLSEPGVRIRPELVFYVLVRQAMLEQGVDDILAADYVASMLLKFGQHRRAYRVSADGEEEYGYLVDMVLRLETVRGGEAFLLRTHMGNYSLWLTGIFPDFLDERERRRGAPSIRYYERMGEAGYRSAAESPEASSLGLGPTLSAIASDFGGVRSALNRVSDRYLWRDGGNPVGRLLRGVTHTVG